MLYRYVEITTLLTLIKITENSYINHMIPINENKLW